MDFQPIALTLGTLVAAHKMAVWGVGGGEGRGVFSAFMIHDLQ